MKRMYLQAVMDRIQSQCPSLRWVDADEGQLDFYDERPPVAWPCCLMDVALTSAQNLAGNYSGIQRVEVRVQLKVCFNDCASFNARTPQPVREVAFKRMDMLQIIHKALQGFCPAGCMSPFSRQSCRPVRREDGLKMYEMAYVGSFQDDVNG